MASIWAITNIIIFYSFVKLGSHIIQRVLFIFYLPILWWPGTVQNNQSFEGGPESGTVRAHKDGRSDIWLKNITISNIFFLFSTGTNLS
jgi:hypothetical protein